MWKIVIFPGDEVAAVPCSWLIEMQGKLMCFWPEKNARTKRAKDENPPSSGNDKYKLHECRELMNGETFDNFNKALAMEILAQDVSYIDASDSDGDTSVKKQKLSDLDEEEEEFEFIKPTSYKKEINIIADINKTSTTPAASKHENELQSPSFPITAGDKVVPPNIEMVSCQDNQSSDLEKDAVSPNNAVVLLQHDESSNFEKNTTNKNEEKMVILEVPFEVTTHNSNEPDEVEVIESMSDSEKIKKILLNQIAEKKVYSELIARMDRVEKHIKKYGGNGSFSRVIEELPLQVKSKEMFSKLENELLDATNTALVKFFNKTIFEKDIKQFVKILLCRFFDNEFFAHNVTGKAGGKVVLNKTRTLRCIFDCIEKKFNKKKKDVEDTVFKAIDQLKDSLRKKFPKLSTDRKKKRDQTQTFSQEEKLAEDKDQENEVEAAVEVAIKLI